MKKSYVVIFSVILLAIALPAALTALTITDIKLENKSLVYKGETVDKLFISIGNSSFGMSASDILEMVFSPKDSTLTVVSKSQVYIMNVPFIKAIVIDKSKSYIDIKL